LTKKDLKAKGPSGKMEQMGNGRTVFADETIIVAIKEQVSCDLDEESVILAMQDGMYYGLNEVAARIWHMIQQPSKVKEIRDAILGEFEVDQGLFEPDLQSFLWELASKNLIKVQDEVST
jgi:hypothetical protein